MSARVTLQNRRLASLRVSLGLTRWVLYAVAAVGVLAAVHNALAPPRQRTVVVVKATTTTRSAGEWVALSFARAYLSWSPDPAARTQALAPFLTPTADPSAGVAPAPGRQQQVSWAAIAGERDVPGGVRDYTVAAALGGSIRFLVVPVADDHRLAGYPTLIAAPTPAPANISAASLPALSNEAVLTVLDRALRNYLSGSAANLAADLAPGAQVTPAAPGLSLRSIQRLAVESTGTVLATVIVADAAGDQLTLAYEAALARLGGRWEITRIGP